VTGEALAALEAADYGRLFIGLGWDNPIQPNVPVEVDGETVLLAAVAQKRGLVVYVCDGIPEPPVRKRIESAARAVSPSRLLIFHNDSAQIWLSEVPREGRTPKVIPHKYPAGAPADLLQRLEGLRIGLGDEADLTVLGMIEKVTQSFKAEEVTKRFYNRFSEQRSGLAALVENVGEPSDTENPDRAWYASLLLNRLMFLYFMQKKGFLDGDRDYLAGRLKHVRETHGENKFFGFYRNFLLPLFEHGLDNDDRSALDPTYEIDVPDTAFETIFGFFDEWKWHLDSRDSGDPNQINPDILGFIFEQYINVKDIQDERGAFYTGEDITRYITAITVVPVIIEQLRRALALGGISNVADVDLDWTELHLDRNRPEPLRAESAWEAKRRHSLTSEKLEELSGRATVDDLIHANIDLVAYAVDVIRTAEDPRVPLTAWRVLDSIKIIDPTCGSGAFLFAALDILEELYDAAWTQIVADDSPEAADIVAEVETHPSPEFPNFAYFSNSPQCFPKVANLTRCLTWTSTFESATRSSG